MNVAGAVESENSGHLVRSGAKGLTAKKEGLRVTWLGGRSFQGKGNRGGIVLIDGTQKNGVRPPELIPLALGACSGTDVIAYLEDRGAKVSEFDIEIKGIQALTEPWPFTKIRLHYVVRGVSMDSDMVNEGIILSLAEQCTVAATLGDNVSIEYSVEVVSVDDSVPALDSDRR